MLEPSLTSIIANHIRQGLRLEKRAQPDFDVFACHISKVATCLLMSRAVKQMLGTLAPQLTSRTFSTKKTMMKHKHAPLVAAYAQMYNYQSVWPVFSGDTPFLSVNQFCCAENVNALRAYARNARFIFNSPRGQTHVYSCLSIIGAHHAAGLRRWKGCP